MACLLCGMGRTLGIAAMPRLIEAKLTRGGRALARSEDPTEDLVTRGVARINGVLPRELCERLKLHCGELRRRTADAETQKWAVWMGASDDRFVPGTRLRYCDALEQRLTSNRYDFLLPLEDRVVAEAFREGAYGASGGLSVPRGGRAGAEHQSEGALVSASHWRVRGSARRGA